MAYWMTTHWPPLFGNRTEDSPGVWVVEGRQHIIARLMPGDLVWLYELGSGRTVKRTRADGSFQLLPCKRGRQGVVALLEITDPAFARDDIEPEEYTNGTRLWWRWFAPTTTINSAGFVPRPIVATMLGYKPSNPFRGFGHEHSGLMQITESAFEGIRTAYNSSSEPEDIQKLLAVETAGLRRGEGGEGEIHKAMKAFVAANPEDALGEPGLKLVRVEYPFPTGDRIDVVLRDRLGRYVAVEIEPACSEDEKAGPLQCMKYRSLLAYALERRVSEIRTVLISQSIHPAVDEKCLAYKIETRLVDLQHVLV